MEYALLLTFGLLLVVNLAILVLVLRGGTGGIERVVRDEIREGRREASDDARRLREEVARGLGDGSRSTADSLKAQFTAVTTQLAQLTESNRQAVESLRRTIDERLHRLQEGNEKKLDEMRRTVDEKLQGTLEKRLGESFELVRKQLEAVQRGLGEMQSLATGVGDLKRVLTNVKARGTWGEIQLGAILEQVLTPGQYERNVKPRDESDDRVEFAVKLPGRNDEPDSVVWLPIDSKFPQEDYLRLVEASEAADPEGVQQATGSLVRSIRESAALIRDKYVHPPRTTDFAILFLPTEGLYAEVLRQPGLVEDLQLHHRIVLAGPTTLTAILNSLQMGFRTLAIEKRSSEVWKILGAVKIEFAKFAGVLATLRRQLDTARRTIESGEQRTRVMARRLREVEELPADESAREILRLEMEENGGVADDAPGDATLDDAEDDLGQG